MGHAPAQTPITKIYFSHATGLHPQFPAQSFQNPWNFLRDKSSGSRTEGDRAPSLPLKHPGPLSQADEPGLPWQHPARPLLSPAAMRQQVVPSCLSVNPCPEGPWTPSRWASAPTITATLPPHWQVMKTGTDLVPSPPGAETRSKQPSVSWRVSKAVLRKPWQKPARTGEVG